MSLLELAQADAAVLDGWCRRWLGAGPRRRLFEKGHLSRVIGIELSDGRTVVVKVRPAARRIAGCVAVQRHLFDNGFPCPEPLAGPLVFGSRTATAESYIGGGTGTPTRRSS